MTVWDAPHAVSVRGAAHLQELPIPVFQLLRKHHLHRILQGQIRGLPGPLLDVPRPAQRIRTCTVTLLYYVYVFNVHVHRSYYK